MIGETKMIRFSGVGQGDACTVVLRGASHHILEEAERSLHDALCILSQTTKSIRTVCGGGCSEMLMAKVVDDCARATPGKEALAISGFATALRQLPTIIADNAGYDSSDLVTKLAAEHFKGNKSSGLDMEAGVVGDMNKLKVSIQAAVAFCPVLDVLFVL